MVIFEHFWWLFVVVLLCKGFFLYGDNVGVSDDSFYSHNHCELISVKFCQNIEYNHTIMPNLLHHQRQEDASSALHHFVPLLKVKCSPNIQFFLCSLYVPVCTILDKPIPPCRSLCLSAKMGCEDIMNQFGYLWPEDLDCSKFPEAKSDVCVSRNNSDQSNELDTGIRYVSTLGDYNADKQNYDIRDYSKVHEFLCPYSFQVPKSYGYSFKLNNKVISDCGLPCDDMFFTQEEKRFSRIWVGTWSFVCLLCCLFTILTFTLNTTRFRYPERPIIFLSLCCLMISLIYIIGFFSDDKVACRKPFSHSTASGSFVTTVSPITQGTKGELCTILFIVLYFFSMASSIWWVILSFTWFLAAGLKWGHEAIEANSQYFHFVAWSLPAIKSIIILATGKIEGDILTGVCYVGVWDSDMLIGFVLMPLLIYLLLGILFLFLGFVSLFRIRTVMKHDGTKTDKLEKLMIRIGTFSLLYSIPAVIVIACLCYEYVGLKYWMLTWQYAMCKIENKHAYQITCPEKTDQSTTKPSFFIFMLKYLMSFIVGITSSVWIWSGKTFSSWKHLIYRIKNNNSHIYV